MEESSVISCHSVRTLYSLLSFIRCVSYFFFFFFFFNDPATTEIYTLSLHDALPISRPTLQRIPWLRDWTYATPVLPRGTLDRKSTRLNSSHVSISYAVFCLKKKKKKKSRNTQ